MNSIAAAKFFYNIFEGVFKTLCDSSKSEGGILGPISDYFGVVETNGRGMLPLHFLVWVAGN